MRFSICSPGNPKQSLIRSSRFVLLSSVINWGCQMSSNYEIIIYWSEDDVAFVAEVPELPGCMADGRTYQEAVANVGVIIKEWIQTAKELGRPIPQPRGRLMFA